MALDDVVHVLTKGPRVEEALHRTLRWIDRCVAAHSRPTEQALLLDTIALVDICLISFKNLFGIVQGALQPELRKICLEGLIKRNLPGYAIGGLSGGESKDEVQFLHYLRHIPAHVCSVLENRFSLHRLPSEGQTAISHGRRIPSRPCSLPLLSFSYLFLI